MIQTLISIGCMVLLFIIVIAFIFDRRFRKDVIAGKGEVKFLGLLSAKGVIIVVLCTLFLGGAIYTSRPGRVKNRELLLIQNNLLSDIKVINNIADDLKGGLESFLQRTWIPAFINDTINKSDSYDDPLAKLEDAGNRVEKVDILMQFAKQVASVAIQTKELMDPIENWCDKKTDTIHTHYEKILIAVARQDNEAYEQMIKHAREILIEAEKARNNVAEFLAKKTEDGVLNIDVEEEYTAMLELLTAFESGISLIGQDAARPHTVVSQAP